ncbi:MAG: DUF2478 domain-containing protein [Rhodobacteraceae bacterium]|nr:DUF2478 domain-containing protein [Paracoccaceae bacterium]
MNIAFTMAREGQIIDPLLAGLAARLSDEGARLAGIVQHNTDRPDAAPCDMDVIVLPDGPVRRISQFRGIGARGCRLDTHAFETAVHLVASRLSRATDLMIVNKFGKQEAAGRGLRDVIAMAVAWDVPVIVGLNRLNEEAFHAFTDGAATSLDPTPEALLDWARVVMRAPNLT